MASQVRVPLSIIERVEIENQEYYKPWVKPTLAALPAPLEAVFSASVYEELKQDLDQKLKDARISHKDLRSILFWNGLHVCLQIAALVVCIETPSSRVYWPWMAVVASIITMISAGRVFFGYLNLHRAAQWDIYYRFSHNVRVRFPKIQIEWRKEGDRNERLDMYVVGGGC